MVKVLHCVFKALACDLEGLPLLSLHLLLVV